MKILISPAKSLDFKSEIGSFKCTQPKFLSKTQIINSSLKEKTPNDLKKIQNISEKLADLNWTRNNDFNLTHNYKNSRPALFAFNGDVYDGIDAKSLSSDNKLFIDSTALSLFLLSTKIKPALSKIDLKIGILLSSLLAINTVYLFTAINKRGISIKEA